MTETTETAGQFLQRVGCDAKLWAEEFNKTAKTLGYSDMDEGWLIGWFANAIENTCVTRKCHTSHPAPEPVVGVKALMLEAAEYIESHYFTFEREQALALAARIRSALTSDTQAAQEPVGWQTMETAPTSNGSLTFLVHIPGHGQCVCAKTVLGNVYSVSSNRTIHRATHWQPLPAPPAPSAAEGE